MSRSGILLENVSAKEKNIHKQLCQNLILECRLSGS